MKHDLGNVIACLLQSGDQLKDKRSKDDKVSRRMWKVVEAKARKIRMGKTKKKKKEKKKGRNKKKKKREKKEKEKTKERRNNESNEGSRKVRDLG